MREKDWCKHKRGARQGDPRRSDSYAPAPVLCARAEAQANTAFVESLMATQQKDTTRTVAVASVNRKQLHAERSRWNGSRQ